MAQCNAKSKRTGKQCRARAMPNGKCYHHGGAALKGAAHPNFKDGSRSKYMPKFLAPAFAEALNNPELLNLSESIAGQEAIVRDAYDSLNQGEAPTRLVGRIRAEWREFWNATGRGDQEAVAEHRQRIGVLLGQAATVAATLERIGNAEEIKRRLVDTEIKRREKMREQIVFEDAVLLYNQITQANRQEILEFDGLSREDKNRLLNRIVTRFAEIAGLPNPARPAS
jgi:hypothetical protein